MDFLRSDEQAEPVDETRIHVCVYGRSRFSQLTIADAENARSSETR